jgi:hypothetical protein
MCRGGVEVSRDASAFLVKTSFRGAAFGASCRRAPSWSPVVHFPKFRLGKTPAHKLLSGEYRKTTTS